MGLAACSSSTTVIVRASLPDADGVETPAAGLALVALPYDRDSVIAALEAAAPSPRPSTAVLDSAYAEFRTPFAAFSVASYGVQALRDSLRTATAPERRAALEAALVGRQRTVDSLRPVLDAARQRLAGRTDTARAAIRAWQDIAYAGYDTVVRNLARFVDPVADTTDATGLGRFTLRSRRMWITASAWDAADPNAEWYWNVPITGDTVVLSPANARRRPRY